jgi:hypothetical protein
VKLNAQLRICVKVSGGISVPENSASNKQTQRIAYASTNIIAQNGYRFIMQVPRVNGAASFRLRPDSANAGHCAALDTGPVN